MGTTPELVTLQPSTTAVLRERVAMSDLRGFFDRAFGEVLRVVRTQHVEVIGPPFAMYHGTPTDTIDITAGFPVAAPILPDGEVGPSALPGGPAAQLLHRGSYDLLAEAYDRLVSWMGQQGYRPADVMWESYLNEPAPDGDPEANRTLITWPISGA